MCMCVCWAHAKISTVVQLGSPPANAVARNHSEDVPASSSLRHASSAAHHLSEYHFQHTYSPTEFVLREGGIESEAEHKAEYVAISTTRMRTRTSDMPYTPLFPPLNQGPSYIFISKHVPKHTSMQQQKYQQTLFLSRSLSRKHTHTIEIPNSACAY